MQKNNFSKKKLVVSLLFFFTFVAISFFAKESFGRFLSISFLTLFFYFVYFFSNNIPLAFLSFLILALPFNITYQFQFDFVNTLVNNIHVNYLVPTISILDLGVFLFLVSSFLQDKSSFKSIFLKFKLPLILFSIFLLIQNVFFKDFLVLLNSVRFFSYLISFVIFLESIQKSKFSKKNFLTISILILCSVVFQGVVGYLQFKGGSSVGLDFLGESRVSINMLGSSFIALSGREILRAYGTFPHPNMLAGFFLLSLFVSTYLLKKLGKNLKAIPLLTIFLSSIFLIPTFSRVTVLLFVLSSLFLSLNWLRKKPRMYSFFPILLIERFFSLFSSSNTGLVDRVNLLKTTFPLLRGNLFLGTGLGRYVLFMGDLAPLTTNGLLLLQPVHNIFALLLVEFGIFGLLSFLYFLWSMFRKYFKGFTLESVLILFSLVSIGMFDHYFVSLPQGLILFWIFVGLIFVESKKLKNNKKKID